MDNVTTFLLPPARNVGVGKIIIFSLILAVNANAQNVASPANLAFENLNPEGIRLRLTDTLSSPVAKDDLEKKEPEKEDTGKTGNDLAGDSSMQFAGYAKTLLINSKTTGANPESYTESLSRVRLKITYDITRDIQVHVEHDTEVTAGSYLGTTAFRQGNNGPSQQYWNLGSVLADNRNYYVTQHLYRAYIKISGDAADLTVGQQRIPLGTGLMFSALDMLNPINPLLVERDEYVGVDAALLEYKSGTLSKFSLIYAPDPARVSDRWIGQYHTNLDGADFSLTIGKYWEDHLVGVDVATQIGNVGLHGELTYTRPQLGQSYQKLLLGSDYAFANTLTFLAEGYYSSQSKNDILAQYAQNPLLPQVAPLSNRAAGVSVSYEFTPLLKISTLVLFDLADGGRVVYPTLSYSLNDNLVLTGGMQFYSGTVGVVGAIPPGRLVYAQIQYFF